MKKVFKIISAVLVAVMVFGLNACGDKNRSKTKIDFDKQSVTVEEWTTEKMPVAKASDGSTVLYSVGDESMLYLKGTNMTGLKEGVTEIIATLKSDPSVTAKCTVTVKAHLSKRPVLSASCDPVIRVGDSKSVTATLSNSENAIITYAVSDPQKATVDANGKLTAKAFGDITVTVTAKYKTVTFTDTLNVKITQQAHVKFETTGSSVSVNVRNEIKSDLSGDAFTVELNGKAMPVTDGNITLLGADYIGFADEYVDGIIRQSGTDYKFNIKISYLTLGTLWQKGEKLTATNGKYRVDMTKAVDEHGLRYVTFGDAEEKTADGYKYVRIKVNFANWMQGVKPTAFDQLYAECPNYDYHFGYRYGADIYFFYDNRLHDNEFPLTKPDGEGMTRQANNGMTGARIGFNIYSADGKTVIMDCMEETGWTKNPAGGDYINLELNTDYIFEFGISGMPDLMLGGFDNAVISEITWSKTTLK